MITFYRFLTILTQSILIFNLLTTSKHVMALMAPSNNLETSTRSNGSFTASIFHKPTFTGLFTNFESFLLVYKKGIIFSLLFRHFKFCSSYVTFYSEITRMKSFLRKNGYPDRFVDSIVSLFLDKILSSIPKQFLTPIHILYFSLPYTGPHCL